MEIVRQRAGGASSTDELRVRQLKARQLLRGELHDEDLDQYVQERLLVTTMKSAGEWVQNWGRANALFPATFGLACCAMEHLSLIHI